MHHFNYSTPKTLAIGLGANLPSKIGSPTATIIAARPMLEREVCLWIKSFLNKKIDLPSINKNIDFNWSPLFETKALGGPLNQPSFINAVLITKGSPLSSIKPSEDIAIDLLKRLLNIEKYFGRDRHNSKIHWGPRVLDIDLLGWGALQVKNNDLTLPHPHLIERDFVLIPLGAALEKEGSKPRRLSPQLGWEE